LTIAEYAESEHFDLIMMPTHGHGPFRRLLLGSVAAKVLHDATCPVWTSVHCQERPIHVPAQPRRIAAAVDLGPHSTSVLRWAGRLSEEFKAPLRASFTLPRSTRGWRTTTSRRNGETTSSARQKLNSQN
jgi:K+-sensing histidine kinase KdpD